MPHLRGKWLLKNAILRTVEGSFARAALGNMLDMEPFRLARFTDRG